MQLIWERLKNSLTYLRSEIFRKNNFFMDNISQSMDRLLLLSGRQACMQLRPNRNIMTFEEIEFRVFSQWSEDGIIEWILQNLPVYPKTFIEFGVETFQEANTRFLIENRNWKGLVIDGSDENIRLLHSNKLYWMFDLTAVAEFIDRENIDQIITKNGFAGELGILSIDIDGNDYWVLEAINCVNPIIIICEYNAILGDKYPITIPYDPSFSRLAAHHSGLYFGASIAAIKSLANRKGYKFLGTNSNGINAFFIRKDLFHYLEPLIGNRKAYPSKHRDSRDANGVLTYSSGLTRYELIKHLPIIRLDTGEKVPIESLGMLYSQEWLSEMSVNIL